MKQSFNWSRAELVLNVVTKDEEPGKDASKNLGDLTKTMRIPATTHIFTSGSQTFSELLKEKSVNADLVFLGLATPGEHYDEYLRNFMDKTEGLPTTVFVLAGEEVAFERC